MKTPSAEGRAEAACNDDLPLELRGHITHPQRAGYQLLTNYESTYWRAAVGNDAWSLYEVLRSYCHRGDSECFPSINLLLATLGIRDRSVLIGRATPKRAGGKLYHYPGLLATLQEAGLVVVETIGERAVQRYRFHVNLTPDLLSEAQVARLPALLQAKHGALLHKCHADWERMQARRAALAAPDADPAPTAPTPPSTPPTPPSTPPSAPSAPSTPPPPTTPPAPPSTASTARAAPVVPVLDQTGPPTELPNAFIHPPSGRLKGCGNSKTPPTSPIGNSKTPPRQGVGNSHTPIGNSEPEYGNFQHKQQQENNTQRTKSKKKNNNNNRRAAKSRARGDSLEAVVVALTSQGLSQAVAQRLAEQHDANYIRKKIAYLEHMLDRQPEKVKNPHGWLLCAIEHDYAAPAYFGLTREEVERRHRHRKYTLPEYEGIIIS